jgi:hypothetical protein
MNFVIGSVLIPGFPELSIILLPLLSLPGAGVRFDASTPCAWGSSD